MPKRKHFYQQYEPLPGSHKQRNRARNILTCKENSENSWIISGGENEHLVIRRFGGFFLCDCDIATNEKKICSHVIKVLMELGQFPTEPKLVTK